MAPAPAGRVIEDIDADVVVVGSGIAGLCAALTAAPRRVLLVSPGPPEDASSSALAQGGIAAPVGHGDSVDAHVTDTLVAADHSADGEVVRRVISEAPGAVRFLQDCGVEFDRAALELSLHREAGHGLARVVHAGGDRSGLAIVSALHRAVAAAAHVAVAGGLWLDELCLSDGEGVVGLRLSNPGGRRVRVRCRDTVLATGGIGQMFRYTTNGRYATGDGLAMALAAGARTTGLEFVQFHPTALRVDADPLPLLTEALRGAGARLVTRQGERLMEGRHPLGDLAPRDVVARAVWEHTQGGGEVLLDATAVFSGALASQFPGAWKTARSHGLDPAVDPLPVVAAAHYHMGGVAVDERGRTTVPRLWACGEVTNTGLHGANRLASNSLLEAVVYGRAVGAGLAGADGVAPRFGVEQAWRAGELAPVDDARWQRLRDRMSAVMGPVREGGALQAAISVTAAERTRLAREDDTLARRYALAVAMMSAALRRTESRGAHWRRDHPARWTARDGSRALDGQAGDTRRRAG